MSDDSAPRKTRYRFIGRSGNQYVWQSTQRMPGDSRFEEIRCRIDYFWNPGGAAR